MHHMVSLGPDVLTGYIILTCLVLSWYQIQYWLIINLTTLFWNNIWNSNFFSVFKEIQFHFRSAKLSSYCPVAIVQGSKTCLRLVFAKSSLRNINIKVFNRKLKISQWAWCSKAVCVIVFLQNQYCGCRWAGYISSQPICRHNMNQGHTHAPRSYPWKGMPQGGSLYQLWHGSCMWQVWQFTCTV